MSDSAEESIKTNSIEFLKKEKVSMKKILDKVFIHVYSYYWKKISLSDERLINMNKEFNDKYQEVDNDEINLEEDGGKFDNYKKIVIAISLIFSFFYFSFL